MNRSLVNKLILLLTIVITSVFTWQFGKAKITFYGDAFGYYLYLPSTFIHHNIKTPFTIPPANIRSEIMWSFNVIKGAQNEKGFYLNQYTYGVALMESPFFFIAHIYEKLKGLPANGYTDTYDTMIKLGALFYAALGLLIVYSILRRYFTTTLSLLGSVALFLCTNLFWFAIFQAGMAHVPLFFLYALLVWLTIKIHERPTTYLIIALGLTAGIITLIRPTDILCLLIPLLYNVYSKATIREKVQFIKEHRKLVGVAIIAFILPVIPQLLYWKAVTGHLICYSYGDQSFDFAHPKIIEGLFYFNNGWLPYSPIMLFSLLGLIFYQPLKKWEWCIAIVFCLYVYIIYSWHCYYYLNGLGSRPMIHLYPLLAIPLTAFFNYISGRHLLIKIGFISLCLFFAAMNLCYSIQQVRGVIDTVESNMAYNLQMLFRTQLTYNDLVVRDIGECQPDSHKLTKLRTLAFENFEDSLSSDYLRDATGGSKYTYHWHDEDYMEVAVIAYNKDLFKDAKWFRCSGKFLCPNNADYYRHLMVLDINEKEKLWRGFKIENNLPDAATPLSLNRCVVNKWGKVSFFAKVPRNLKDGDIIKLIMWVTDKKDIYMDDVSLELYR